jgi:POT family proton-dependent oligopeptide transporter
LAGFGIFLGLIQYKLTGHYLAGKGEAPEVNTDAAKTSQRKMWKLAWGVLGLLFVTFGLFFTGVVSINAPKLAASSNNIIALVAVCYFVYLVVFGGLDKEEKKKVGVIAILFSFTALFWSGFEQAGSTLNLFAERFTDRSVWGFEIPTGYFQSVNSLFIILFAPFFGAMWIWLGRRKLEPSSPLKFAFGLLFLGIGFLVMYFAAKVAASGELAAPTWLILTYLFHTLGELSLSPVGLSLTTKLAPKKYAGQLMGMWFLSIAMGNLIAGRVAGSTSGGTEEALQQMPSQYLLIVYITVGAGIVLVLLSKPIRSLMGSVR